MLLLCAGLAQGAWAQIKITGPGFLPDESGTNLDNPLPTQQQKLATGTVIKDCAECPELVVVPAGGFTMGSSAQEQALANSAGVSAELTARESPQHYVRVPSFAAGRYAVTKGEFAAFVRSSGYRTEAERGDGCYMWTGKEWKKDAAYNWRNVGFTQGDDHPVVCVSWNDAQAYIQWINRISGKSYRLPSEAEREYAARGGTQTAFWWGDSITTSQANYNGNHSYNGSPKGQSRQATVPVNGFSANPFGLYNVHGNVWEWVEDCWHENYAGAPTDGSAWTTDCSGKYRVLRGGSWNYNPVILRSAFRDRGNPVNRYDNHGFRLSRTLEVAREEDVTRRAGPSANYGTKVVATIRPHISTIKELSANLTVEYDVYTDASGRIESVKIRKRSGDAYWDDEALNAILKTRRLPFDDDGRVPSPMTISLRPRD